MMFIVDDGRHQRLSRSIELELFAHGDLLDDLIGNRELVDDVVVQTQNL
jgi:hypothetical protein